MMVKYEKTNLNFSGFLTMKARKPVDPNKSLFFPNALAAILEEKAIAEFHRGGCWLFDPTEYGFKVAYRAKGIFSTDKTGDKSYYEACKKQESEKCPCGCRYTCFITRLVEGEHSGLYGEKDYRFILSETHMDCLRNDRQPVTLEYTIPTPEIAKLILADSVDLAKWFGEVCTEPEQGDDRRANWEDSKDYKWFGPWR